MLWLLSWVCVLSVSSRVARLSQLLCFGFISKRRDPVSRNKRLRGAQSLSAVTAALKDDEDDSEEEMVEVTGEDQDNPKVQLYLAVKTASNASGLRTR